MSSEAPSEDSSSSTLLEIPRVDLEEVLKAEAVQFLRALIALIGYLPVTSRPIHQIIKEINNLSGNKVLTHVMHDLRNKIGVFGVLLELESEKVVLEGQKEVITSNLGQMIDNIEDPSERKYLNLLGFLDDTSDEIAEGLLRVGDEKSYQDLGNQKRTLSIECPRNIEVSTNPYSLQRILTNLVKNAFRHNQNEILEVRLVVEEKETHVEITVADTGKGLQKPIEDLLEDGATEEREKVGHGHGLAIVIELVEKIGGKLEGGNNESGGAYFRVFLPKDANQSL